MINNNIRLKKIIILGALFLAIPARAVQHDVKIEAPAKTDRLQDLMGKLKRLEEEEAKSSHPIHIDPNDPEKIKDALVALERVKVRLGIGANLEGPRKN